VELYAPRGVDEQRPHERDELYIVVTGRGRFRSAGTEVAFAPGDLLFVPAGMEHRFEAFGDDLVVWVVFFGPHGGYGVG
jgi:mannose-6-phosphate isomerase-like protein (cupin superfamily)